MTATAAIRDLSFRARIEALRRTKSEHTEEKIRRNGYHDSDDHGWIPWPEPISFTPKSNHPDGGCYGAKCIGDAFDGGVDIYLLTCDGLGLATVSDSLAAIEQRVVREKRLTWEELAHHLENDYADAEDVRLMLAAIPRYGSGGSLADAWAKRIADLFEELVRGTPTPDGFTILPGLFSHGGIAHYGRRLGATPNGRRAGAPIAHSADPDPGFMPDGGGAPTAKANAVARVQPRWGNTTPLQLDIEEDLSRQIGGIESVEALIRGHEEMGGTLINLNVISGEQILEAHADPSKYPDLVVRVTGYSAYFRSLSPEYRQQIVDRLLAAT